MNPRTIYTCAAAAILLAVISVAYADNAPTDQSHTETCKIVYPDGKPAADATLYLDLLDKTTNALTISAYKADKLGIVRATISPHEFENAVPIPYITSPTGFGFPDQSTSDGRVATFTLQPFTSVQVHFVDPDGKPVPRVTVSPFGFSESGSPDIIRSRWDDRIPGGWTQTTDDSGMATFNNLPQGYDLIVSAADGHYLYPDTKKPILLSNAPTTPDATVTLTPAGAVSGTVVDGTTNTPQAGITILAEGLKGFGHAVSDSNGHFTFDRLAGGRYVIVQTAAYAMGVKAPSDWISDPQYITVDTGADASGVVLRLFHGGLITGKVTDKATGRPLADVPVSATPADGQTLEIQHDDHSATTGADGAYSLRISPCIATVTIQPAFKTTGTLPQTKIDIKEGDVKTINSQVKGPGLIYGIVLGPNGKPVPGASVVTRGTDPYAMSQDYTTDSKGCFVADTNKLAPKSTIEAEAGNLGTAAPVLYNGKPQITLHIIAGSLCTFKGKVVAPAGKSLPAGPIVVTLIRIYTMEAEGNNYVQCDAKGNYEFTSIFGNATYMAQLQADGYAISQTKQITVKAGETVQMPPLVLRPNDSFVGGLVLDSKGKPVADCNVTDQDIETSISGSQIRVTTDKSGRFFIKGAPTGKTTIIVDERGISESIEATSGRKDNVIHLPLSPF